MAGIRKTAMALLTVGLAGLAGCVTPPPDTPPPPPATHPEPPIPPTKPRSQASLEMAAFYKQRQAYFLVNDLLRVDGGGPDTPFLQRNLVDNFIRIAMFSEYKPNDSKLIARPTATRLNKWQGPIRMQVKFGETVPLEQRNKDRASIRKYTKRLSRLTGLPITLTNQSPNFFVFIVDEEQRRALGPTLKQVTPQITTVMLNLATQMDREQFCMVAAFSASEDSPVYSRAVAVIRAEHPDLLRLSCIHEELAQGLGLANDSPAARPSIFNDDQEFALLTHHDELLLQMLYDDRLRPGMTVDEVRPIAEQIAAELMGGSS
ncbi:DUF2927 domain-containing protein [Profundibacter sp.]